MAHCSSADGFRKEGGAVASSSFRSLRSVSSSGSSGSRGSSSRAVAEARDMLERQGELIKKLKLGTDTFGKIHFSAKPKTECSYYIKIDQKTEPWK